MINISATSGEPHEKQRQPSRVIADELRAAIAGGSLSEGIKLPSERQLAEQYGTARNTAREALRILSEEGLVIAQHGKGVFVRQAPQVIRLGSDRYSHKYRDSGLSPFLLECQRAGKVGRFEVLSIDRVPALEEVAKRLAIPADAPVLRRENIFYADADPVQRVSTFIPWDIAKGTGLLEPEVPHQYGIHGILEERGYVMARQREEVSARMPRPDEARDLRIPPGVPVLVVLHTSVDNKGESYEFTRFVIRADTGGLIYDVPVEG